MGTPKITFQNETVAGYDVHVYSASPQKTPTVFLVHGVGVSHEYYRPFMEHLSAQFRVVAIDLPGFGTTDEPRTVLGIDELAEIVVRVVNKYKNHASILVGHSMGTQVVVEAASAYPSVCDKLVLLAPTVNDREKSFWKQLGRLIQDSFYEPFRLKLIAFRDYMRAGPIRMVRTVNSMLQDDMEQDAAKLQMPVLVINGTKDPVAPDSWAKRLATLVKQGILREISDGTHAFQYTHAAQVAELCTRFIQDQVH